MLIVLAAPTILSWTPDTRSTTPLGSPMPQVIDAPAERLTSLDPAVRVTGANPSQRHRLDEALGAFRSAGLALPDLQIDFHSDDTACDGHYGLYHDDLVPPRVSICSELEFVVAHELAHAWEAANLTEDDRRQYLQARALTSWNDPVDPWADRGIEDAAFVVQQNLSGRDIRPDRGPWPQRISAYEMLTELPSPLVDQTLRPGRLGRQAAPSPRRDAGDAGRPR